MRRYTESGISNGNTNDAGVLAGQIERRIDGQIARLVLTERRVKTMTVRLKYYFPGAFHGGLGGLYEIKRDQGPGVTFADACARRSELHPIGG